MPNQFVISVMARDRVGIIADVTTVLKELGGNLADLSQTVVCGYFTMIAVASFPDRLKGADIRERLEAIDPTDPFHIGIRVPAGPVEHEPWAYGPGHYVLTAVGPDTTGLVAAVTSYLREREINIDDLTTRVEEGQYVMILSIDFPPEGDIGEFRAAMRTTMHEIGVAVEIQHHDLFRALNEI